MGEVLIKFQSSCRVFLRILIALLVIIAGNAHADAAGVIKLFKKHFEDFNKAKTKKERIHPRLTISLQSLLVSMVGVTTKKEEAQEIFDLVKKASDLKISCAEFALSIFYYDGYPIKGTSDMDGQVVSGDRKKSMEWLKLSADHGCPEGQAELGVAYSKGDGVLENDREAAKWFQQSAQNGNAGAMVQLSLRMATGMGLKTDKKSALAWIILAESLSNQILDEKVRNAIPEFKKKLKDGLPQGTIEGAQELAIKFKKQVEANQEKFEG